MVLDATFFELTEMDVFAKIYGYIRFGENFRKIIRILENFGRNLKDISETFWEQLWKYFV